MSQSTIIIDPKSEIRAKQSFNNFIVKPTRIKTKESIKIEDIRALLEWSAKTNFNEGKRVAVIEDYSKIGFNATHTLLKLLEEPPADLHIIIIADKADSILETIRSRCMILPSARLTEDQLNDWQLERVEVGSSGNQTSWQNFSTGSPSEQLRWIASFVKDKQNLSEQLQSWQKELSALIAAADITEKQTHIRNLYLIEQSISAAAANVLPRLVLNTLAIQLSSESSLSA